MKSRSASNMEEQAIGWVIRTRDPAFAEWDDFTAWLESDPEHPAAYDRLALADSEMDEALVARPAPALASAVHPPARRQARTPFADRRSVLGLGIAATLAATLFFVDLTPRTSPYVIQTAEGETRSVTLADGSRVDLNGATRLSLDRDEPRFARLDRGEALFTVIHDEERPFRVEAGDSTIVDAGTVFNVIHDTDATDVAVAEGAVIFNPDAEKVRLDAGRALRLAAGQDSIQVRDVKARAVGSWRRGHLIYDGAPLALVAADLRRGLGMPVRLGPGLAARPFSGVIRIDGDRDQAVRRAAVVMGLEARRTRQGWILAAGSDAAR
jgi:transmembrane sensor